MITLQVGQCGNQVGSALFSVLAEEALDTSRPHHRATFDRFFRLKADSQHPIARAVLVDMEPKVIHTCVERASTFRYDTARTFARQSGSANNWAFGYHFHGPSTRDAVMDLIRKEVELADRLTGFLALHSLAGGTGSGVGAYITDAVRDEFGARAALFNAVVWPFEVGEVILQNYNSLLTLSSLTQSSDAVILMENEQLHRICRQRLRLASPTFDDLNSVLARTLASALLPTYSSTPAPSRSAAADAVELDMLDIVQHLCSHPGYRLTSLKTIPQVSTEATAYTQLGWPYLMKTLQQMHIADSAMEEGIDWSRKLPDSDAVDPTTAADKCVSAFVSLRGRDVFSADASGFTDPRLYASWSFDPLLVARSAAPFHHHERSACVWATTNACALPLQRTLQKAESMFDNGAYVHHYHRFGLEEQTFRDRFADVEQVVLNYQSI